MHLDIERLHKQHGAFVRYAPNRLLVGSVDGFHDIYGPLKKVRKSASYVVHGPGNLLGYRDKAVYARKKRIFAQGFSDAAIREHEPKVREMIGVFCDKMLENDEVEKGEMKKGGWSTAKNMTLWCKSYYILVKLSGTDSEIRQLSHHRRNCQNHLHHLLGLITLSRTTRCRGHDDQRCTSRRGGPPITMAISFSPGSPFLPALGGKWTRTQKLYSGCHDVQSCGKGKRPQCQRHARTVRLGQRS